MTRIDRCFAGTRTRALAALSALSLFSLFACESQVTPRYRGEPLLSLIGSVTIAEEIARSDLVPTLAFPG